MAKLDDEVRERLIRILDTFTCGVLAQAERKIVFANEKLAQMLGCTRASLWGHSIYDFVPQELRDMLAHELELTEKGDLRARLTALQRQDGTSTPVLVLPMADFQTLDDDRIRYDLVIDLGAVMTAKHMLYDGDERLRTSLSRIALDLQSASLLAGRSPAVHPDLHHPDLEDLSKRERDVLARLVDGDRVPAIADNLFISPHTVRNHLKSIFRKLEVSSQSELIERMRNIRR